MTSPSIAAFSPMCLSCMLLSKFHQSNVKRIVKTLAISDDFTEEVTLNSFVTYNYIGVSYQLHAFNTCAFY